MIDGIAGAHIPLRIPTLGHPKRKKSPHPRPMVGQPVQSGDPVRKKRCALSTHNGQNVGSIHDFRIYTIGVLEEFKWV